MVHLALTLSLLAPPADVPARAPAPPLGELRLGVLPTPSPRHQERLAGAGAVLLGQALSLGVLAANEKLLVQGGGDLRHPAPASQVLGVATELVLVPLLVALGSAAVARSGTPGDVFDALAHTFRARGAGLALLAGLSAVAALGQLPLLAGGGLLVLFASDYLVLPAAASLGLHAPDAPGPVDLPPGPPTLEPPPRAGLPGLRVPFAG